MTEMLVNSLVSHSASRKHHPALVDCVADARVGVREASDKQRE